MLKIYSEILFLPRKYCYNFSTSLIKQQFTVQSSIMQEENKAKRLKYDGRLKKRQWQDRRSDNRDSKISKTNENSEPFERIKRRKYAMLMGYCGVGYFGMQRNPTMKTIEEDLFNALFKTNHINQECFDVVQNMQFQRAARTDKGVSAVRQVVSLKLPDKVDIESINKELPEVIRVFCVNKVTKGFNSKTNCDSRTYSYTLPTVAFADKDAQVEQHGFRLDDETFARVNRVLSMYVGSKNFHNFTSKKHHQDPSANRYIISFICERPFLRNDVEFAVLKVQGQSFMLHQIRKMVALMLAVIRNHTNEATLLQALTNEKVNVPRAPGLGLLLEFVHYDRYNLRYGEDGIHQKLEWQECENDVEAFKNKYILPVITETEISQKEMLVWLSKLRGHRYDIFEDTADDDEDEEKLNDENIEVCKDDDKNDTESVNSMEAKDRTGVKEEKLVQNAENIS
ncbi:tRNA pseudouridine synthase A [Harmonia axyridis]|uniref:tRNA pseudouridine synthase A n=1 Tax=Harmonia axyridis TaxID=115357 RepID=UPI001E277A53|nr:tRNA pseudouridine synthase A [Harmonia axyridis]